MKHGFLILNYNSYPDVIKAVKSIYKVFEDPLILVVDNCSTDHSYIKLQEASKTLSFELIKTTDNLGFGNGNNYGFNFLNSNYDLDYIHVLNPDIVILSKDFKTVVESLDFYVLGPDVILESEQKSSSPIRTYNYNFKLKDYAKAMKRYTFCYEVLMTLFAKRLNGKLEKSFNMLKSKKGMQIQPSKLPVLSGCYLIFSKEYFSKVNFLYYPKLFLYDEEVTMSYILARLNYADKIVYHHQLKVLHQHQANFGNWKTKVKCVKNNYPYLLKLDQMSTNEIKKMWLREE